MNKKEILKKLFTKKYLTIILLALAFAGFAAKKFIDSKDDETTFCQTKIEKSEIVIKVLATGTIQPQNRLEIKPPISGRIEKVFIKEGQYVKKGKVLALMSSTERAALLDSVQSQGQAEIKKWEEIYPPTPIIAPIDGTIVLKNVESGQSFTSVDAILVMSDRLIVKAQVDETDIGLIKLKQQVEVILDAYSEEKISANVDKIAFDATVVNNVTTYIVDVLPDEVPSFMRSGMTANVTFFVDGKKDILTIPNDAIKTKDDKSAVLILEDGNRLEKEVILGITDGKFTEVLSGLKEGDIILSPQVKFKRSKEASSSPFAPSRSSKARK